MFQDPQNKSKSKFSAEMYTCMEKIFVNDFEGFEYFCRQQSSWLFANVLFYWFLFENIDIQTIANIFEDINCNLNLFSKNMYLIFFSIFGLIVSLFQRFFLKSSWFREFILMKPVMNFCIVPNVMVYSFVNNIQFTVHQVLYNCAFFLSFLKTSNFVPKNRVLQTIYFVVLFEEKRF